MLVNLVLVVDYTHSTAPNRRFPDLITQRLLFNILTGTPPVYDYETLSALAKHCTEQEAAISKVERKVTKSAGALLMRDIIGSEFDAIVTGIKEDGTYLRLLSLPLEGRLVQGFEGREIGDQLLVNLAFVDVENGYLDFVTETKEGFKRPRKTFLCNRCQEQKLTGGFSKAQMRVGATKRRCIKCVEADGEVLK